MQVRELNSQEKVWYAEMVAGVATNAAYFGPMAYLLRPVVWDTDTFATDSHGRVYVNFSGKNTGTWNFPMRCSALLHELFHNLFNHHQRSDAFFSSEAGRPIDPSLWNKGADIEINPVVNEMGGLFHLDPETFYFPNRIGHRTDDHITAEKATLLLIEKDENEEPGSGSDSPDGEDQEDGGGGCSHVSDEARKGADEVVDRVPHDAVEGSVQETARAIAANPGTAPGALSQWATEILTPVIDWRAELRKLVGTEMDRFRSTGRKQSWSSRSRRMAHLSKDYVIPGRTTVRHRVLIGVDKSYSMAGDPLRQALSEIDAVLSSRSVGSALAFTVDTVAAETFPLRSLPPTFAQANGGTDMRVAFDVFAKHDANTNILLTDGETPWPGRSIPKRSGVNVIVVLINSRDLVDSLVTTARAGLPKWVHVLPVITD